MLDVTLILFFIMPAFLIHAAFFRVFFRSWDLGIAQYRAGEGTNRAVLTVAIGSAVYCLIAVAAVAWIGGGLKAMEAAAGGS